MATGFGRLPEQPIAWSRTGNGEFPFRADHAGSELTIRVNDFPAEPLYTLLIDGRPGFDLEDWPSAWTRPLVGPEALRVAGDARAGRGRFDAIVVADWAHRLCAVAGSPAERVIAAFGLTGELVEAIGYRLLMPPPAGVDRLEISERDGSVTDLQITPTGGGPHRAELDELLGPGRDGVRVHWDSPHPVRYRVTVGAAPYACNLVAYFANPPSAGSPPTGQGPAVRLMLQRGNVELSERGPAG
ncbi:hypothetical protein [Pseudofrankia inefficax]|uniref:Uncharacterized protein n=1 Tax=Pseudofrankia inefficax (strain DSM 45817 / CECT 9037 / DDB 130130 / EuI1c) TaxID=298654 RepID=E3J4F4_PSEI1|nr:hypothetical protein [Pseudofrankia inefficax]ADP83073.1 hypothetical protein FraEuI1c_5084 [Pseudofrankia inefficax]